MNGKGQVEVEAVAAVGVVLLFFVLGMVLVTIRNNEVNALQEVQFKEAQCRKVSEIIGFLNATQAIESLVSFEGTPSNWEELPLQQVQEIGLADESKTINEAKLNAFKNLSADYNSTKVLLNLGLFDYFFS